MGRGAKGIKPEDVLAEDEYADVRLGEIAHHIFQAANRGAVRSSVGDGCPEGCHLHIVFNANGVPDGFLEDRIFPEATLVDWEPAIRLQGQRQTALGDFLVGRGIGTHARSDAAKAVGVGQDQLRKLLQADRLQRWLGLRGLKMNIDKKNIELQAVKIDGSLKAVKNP